MPTNRGRRTRKPVCECSPELIAWAKGEGPHPVEGYFLNQAQYDELMRLHGTDHDKPGSDD